MGSQIWSPGLRWQVGCSIFSTLIDTFRSGGGPVEIGSGIGGLAYSWVLGRRSERELINFRPHNVGGFFHVLPNCFNASILSRLL